MRLRLRAWTRVSLGLLDLVLPPRADVRVLRSLAHDGLLPYLAPHTVQVRATGTPGSESVPLIALAVYTEPAVRAAVREAKFHNNNYAAAILGSLLAAYFEAQTSYSTPAATPAIPCGALAAPVILIPVPLSRDRQRERGYNQAERIVRAATAQCGDRIAVRTDLLVRTRSTLPQTSLGRGDRRKNVAGCFAAPPALDPTPVYIVVDDVTTTGATLLDVARALRAEGAEHILLLAVAH